MSGFAPGDAVVCVDASPCRFWGETGLADGAIYRVAGVVAGIPSSPYPQERCGALWLAGVYLPPRLPYSARRFRKIRPADEQFTETVRACKPIKHRVPA